MDKKEDVPETAVVCQCGGFCYLDSFDSTILVCTRPGCGARYKTDEPPRRE